VAKYKPKTEKFLFLPEGEFNTLISEHYGQVYIAQQTGDKSAHDSLQIFDMRDNSDSDYEQALWDLTSEMNEGEGPVTYLGWSRQEQETKWHVGHNALEYWLSLSSTDDPALVTNHNREDGVDLYGAVLRFEFEIARAAPEPYIMLAQAIQEGLLPHGKYLLRFE
jgi:hypothetical protein